MANNLLYQIIREGLERQNWGIVPFANPSQSAASVASESLRMMEIEGMLQRESIYWIGSGIQDLRHPRLQPSTIKEGNLAREFCIFLIREGLTATNGAPWTDKKKEGLQRGESLAPALLRLFDSGRHGSLAGCGSVWAIGRDLC